MISLITALIGCSENATDSSGGQFGSTTTESQLLEIGKDPTGFIFYKNTSDTIVKGTGSGHPDARLRTRYNTIAARHLDQNGKVKVGTVFSDSSLIVKELFTGNVLTTYVFMFKRIGDKNADANGWVWAETFSSGSILYAAANKGSGCINCHSVGIDFTRMNDAHP